VGFRGGLDVVPQANILVSDGSRILVRPFTFLIAFSIHLQPIIRICGPSPPPPIHFYGLLFGYSDNILSCRTIDINLLSVY
jgi:hypothetical protein